jgi:protein-S-isoprenylcysteine O-methyltransferase Ste14
MQPEIPDTVCIEKKAKGNLFEGDEGRMAQRFLTSVLALVFLFGCAVPAAPFIMFPLTPAFPWRLPLSLLFAVLALEKIYAMCFRLRDKARASVEKDWTSVSVGLTYTIVVYAVIIEFFIRQRGISFPFLSVLGFVLYAVAVALRYWAFAVLQQQWAIHVDRSSCERTLISHGPYRFVRHPLYLGAILETIGLPLAFNSFWALLPALFLFLPLEIQRAYFEEKYLRQIFGHDYDEFAKRTWAFIPLPGNRRRSGHAP